VFWTDEDLKLAMGDVQTDDCGVLSCQDTFYYTDETTIEGVRLSDKRKTEMLPFIHWIITESCAFI